MPPSPPQNPGYHVQHYGPHNVTVTVQWGYPEFDGGVPVDNYTISGANIMTTTSRINETTLSLPYNARQTIEVAATNCIRTSRTATFTYFKGRAGGIIMITFTLVNYKALNTGVGKINFLTLNLSVVTAKIVYNPLFPFQLLYSALHSS